MQTFFDQGRQRVTLANHKPPLKTQNLYKNGQDIYLLSTFDKFAYPLINQSIYLQGKHH